MQSYVIHLIRHGSVAETLKGKYIGSTDVSLSKEGRENLVLIRETAGYPEVQKVFSSPLLRCTESCEIIFPGHEIKCLSSFSECDFGEWEGKGAAELSGDPRFAQWLQNSDKTPPPGGESGRAGRAACVPVRCVSCGRIIARCYIPVNRKMAFGRCAGRVAAKPRPAPRETACRGRRRARRFIAGRGGVNAEC